MKVAGIEVGDRPLILAPMEDVTNPPFRKFCKKYGADWLYSEFVSADALVRSVNKSLKKLTIDETERPVTIQIYGRFIDSMVEAAKIVENRHEAVAKYRKDGGGVRLPKFDYTSYEDDIPYYTMIVIEDREKKKLLLDLNQELLFALKKQYPSKVFA